MEHVDLSGQDAQTVAELGLKLNNLSFVLSSLMKDDTALNEENLLASIFTVQCHVDKVSSQLQALSSKCRICLGGETNRMCAAAQDFLSFPGPMEGGAFKLKNAGKIQ